jgi:hypothetical protein
MKTQAEVKAWLTSLEAERHDRSYLQPAKSMHQPNVIYLEKRTNHRKRDNIMYHAGRYAEGARDDQATKSHLSAMKLIGSNK